MIERTADRFGIEPARLAADTGYGSAAMLARAQDPAQHPRGARGLACEITTSAIYATSRRERKKVEMLFAHLERILKLDRLRLRGPCGARDEFLLAATAQSLRKLAKLIPIPQRAAEI
jgi:hypothetical protein